MSYEEAAQLLRKSFDLCGKVLEGETDPKSIERLNRVRDDIEFAIRLLEKRRPAIPLKD